jgi:acyl transferase domain-containing protein/acyl carrier protein
MEEAGFRGGVWRLRKDLPAAVVVGESDGWLREEEKGAEAAVAAQPVKPLLVRDGGEIGKRLLEVVGTALKVRPEELSLDTPVGEYGVDSIVAVELIEHINRAFGAQLRTTDLFNYGTLGAVAAQLEGSVVRTEPAGARVEAGAEDVAIIGMSGRFAGAENLREYWRNLEGGLVTVAEVPATRWGMEEYYDARPGVAGKSVSRWGGFLRDVQGFDALFFRVAPREVLDPRQRLALEECWKAVEDAGYAAEQLSGMNCGVYMGAERGDVPVEFGGEVDFRGALNSMIAARIGYALNLKGACLTVDTACSSSLVAVHLAWEAVRRGECKMALAGGVNVILSPQTLVALSQAGMLSAKGECRAFDAGADGMVLGEGVGVVVLKRLREALADGDPIRAVIRGSGINYDGRTSSVTAPSAVSQAELAKRIYEQSGVAAETIGYVEGHGTGTVLGDPIEVQGLTEAFGEGVAKGSCGLGSVKANIGHAAAASGVAGLLKVVLGLERGRLVPQAQYERANEHIGMERTPFYVPRAVEEWPRKGAARRGAVSSFGASGTNCHMLVEEAPAMAGVAAAAGPWVVVLSAKTEGALGRRREELREWLEVEGKEADLGAVSYTLAAGRSQFGERQAWVVESREELVRKLAGGRSDEHALVRRYLAGGELDLATLFPGHPPRRISLPAYPFERETNLSTEFKREMEIDSSEWFVRDHRLHDIPVLPGVAYLEMARTAGEMAFPGDRVSAISDVVWVRPVILNQPRVTLSISLHRNGHAVSFEIADGENLHTTGQLYVGDAAVVAPAVRIGDILSRCPQKIPGEAVYEAFASFGVQYGDAFRRLRSVQAGSAEVIGELEPLEDLRPDSYLHPAVLDASLQTVIALEQSRHGSSAVLGVPYSLQRLEILGPLSASRYVYAQAAPANNGVKSYDLWLADETGRILARLDSLSTRPLQSGSLDEVEELLDALEAGTLSLDEVDELLV